MKLLKKDAYNAYSVLYGDVFTLACQPSNVWMRVYSHHMIGDSVFNMVCLVAGEPMKNGNYPDVGELYKLVNLNQGVSVHPDACVKI